MTDAEYDLTASSQIINHFGDELTWGFLLGFKNSDDCLGALKQLSFVTQVHNLDNFKRDWKASKKVQQNFNKNKSRYQPNIDKLLESQYQLPSKLPTPRTPLQQQVLQQTEECASLEKLKENQALQKENRALKVHICHSVWVCVCVFVCAVFVCVLCLCVCVFT